MENTSKPLPSAGALISDAWKLFTTNWNSSVKITMPYLYLGLAYLACGILMKFNPAFTGLLAVVGIGGSVIIFWTTIRLMMSLLDLEAGKKPPSLKELGSKAWTLFLPLLWVAILVGLVVIGSTLLLILPGIYFSIALKFSSYALVDQNQRGTQALATSRALVRGRWWSTFWRLIAGGIVFGLLVGIIAWALILLAGLIVPGFNLMSADAKSFDSVAYGTSQFIQMAVLASFVPLLMGFEVKLYRALQKTR